MSDTINKFKKNKKKNLDLDSNKNLLNISHSSFTGSTDSYSNSYDTSPGKNSTSTSESEPLVNKKKHPKKIYQMEDFEFKSYLKEKKYIRKNILRKEKTKVKKVVTYESYSNLMLRISKKAKKNNWEIINFQTLYIPENQISNNDIKRNQFDILGQSAYYHSIILKQVIRVYYQTKNI